MNSVAPFAGAERMSVIMLRLLKAERMKLKRSPVWLIFFFMALVPALLGTLNYMNNLDLLKSEWFSLWTQHTLFTDYFFLPIMVGVYCSYIMRIEQNNHNWNKVLTMPVSRGAVFVAKLITVGEMVLLSVIWICALFVLSGKIAGITAPIPFTNLAVWCACGALGGIVMAAVQLLLSLYIRSFALPIGIALAGGISGLFALAKGFGHIWPYSLMAYGMSANAPQQIMESGYLSFVVICVLYIAVLTLLGSGIMARRDV